jgi:hypothetical protein
VRSITQVLFLMLIVVTNQSPSQADSVPLSFLNTAMTSDFDFDSPTGNYVTTLANGVAGIQLSFTAIVQSNTGNLNATTTNFGINATNLDPPNDDTDELDGVQGAETVRISFTAPANVTNLTLQSILIGGFGVNDSGTLTIGANSSNITSSGSGTTIPVHSNLDGQFIDVSYTGTGAGFGFNGLTLNAIVAVPEASSFILGGLICTALAIKFGGRRVLARVAS